MNVFLSYIRSLDSLESKVDPGILPYILSGLQVAVLVYVWRQIKRVTTQLHQSTGPTLAASELSTGKPRFSPQRRLEIQMRFWVKVSAIGTVVTLFALVTFAFANSLLYSLTYRIVCGVLTIGKQTNVFAQLMISKPVTSGNQTGHSSGLTKGGRVAPLALTQELTNSASKGQTRLHG